MALSSLLTLLEDYLHLHKARLGLYAGWINRKEFSTATAMSKIVLWPVIQQVLGATAISAAIICIAVCASKPQSLAKFDSWRLRSSLDQLSVVRSQKEPSAAGDGQVEERQLGCSFNSVYVSYRADSCMHTTGGMAEALIFAEPWIGWGAIKSARSFSLSWRREQFLAPNQSAQNN